MDNKKVTIIIPTYNSEKTIQRCIESVTNQTYKNIEIIIINDGSTDKTIEILRKIQSKDDRIKIINQENKGLSITRNIGIKKAKGEFIQFLDSDDFLENFIVEKSVKEIGNEDILIFGCQIVENDIVIEKYCNKNEIWEKNEIVDKVLGNIRNGILMHSACNKLYKKILAEKFEFDFNDIGGEDLIFNIKVFEACKRIKVISSIGYNYSIIEYQTKYRDGQEKIHIKAYKLLNEYAIKYDSELNYSEILSSFLYNSIFYDLLAITNNKKTLKWKIKKYNEIRTELKNLKVEPCKEITKKKNIIFNIFKYNNIFTFFIIKIYCKLKRRPTMKSQ